MTMFKKTFLLLIVTSFTTSLFSQNSPAVISVSPLPNSLSTEKNAEIIVKFNKSISETSISDTSFFVFGRWSGVHRGAIQLDENNTVLKFNSNKNFNSGEQVTVSLSKRIRDTENNFMNKGFTYGYWIKTSPGNLIQERIKTINVREDGEEHIQTYGAYAGDLDDDGFTDFIVPNENTNDIRIFLNDGFGDLVKSKTYDVPGGSRPSTNEGSDFNLDGKIDFALGNSINNIVTVFIGKGNGEFSNIRNYSVGTGIRGLSVADLNGDGFMDIATANRESGNISILLNDGDATFTNTGNINTGSIEETACAFADANNDGILDLFVGAHSGQEMLLLLGDGNGNLNLSSKMPLNDTPWMVATGDIDNDGDADVVSVSSEKGTLSVIRGNGNGSLLAPVNYNSGIFPIAVDLGDLDGDGDLDIVTSNFFSRNFVIFENAGDGSYERTGELKTSGAGSCAVLHDRDNDGDLDITGIDEVDDLLILFENEPGVTKVEDKELNNGFILRQNFPNPFNPSTVISYQIPESGFTTLKIYDILGNEIAVLVEEFQSTGNYKINLEVGTTRELSLPSGVYLYTLKSGNFSSTNKMLLLK